jgi:methionine-rich copper-binding protein CopC
LNGANGWASTVPTAALPGGTHTYYAQAIDNAGLIGAPASTTNVVIVDPAPVVTASSFLFQTAPQRLTITFDQNVSASLSLADVVIRALPSGPTVTPASLTYDTATNTATVTLGGILADGNYRATLLAAGITGPSGVPLAADHAYDFFFLRGDANRDRVVNLRDFNILAANFGQSPRDFTQGDFNYDTLVSLADFNILAARFGAVVAPASAHTSASGSPHAPPPPLPHARLIDTLRDDLLA